MKKFLALAMLLTLGLVSVGFQPAPATAKDAKGVASDDAVIRARCETFAAAWNKHDAAAMAALWAPDGDIINPWGRVAKGRAAVETLFKDEHSSMMKDSKFEPKISGIRVLSGGGGGTAVVDWDVNLTNVHAPDGSKDLPHHVAVVFQKDKSGAWMIEAARPYVFSPGPAAAPKK